MLRASHKIYSNKSVVIFLYTTSKDVNEKYIIVFFSLKEILVMLVSKDLFKETCVNVPKR